MSNDTERETAIAYVRERSSMIESLGGTADGSFVDAEHLKALVAVFDEIDALAKECIARRHDASVATEHLAALFSIVQRVRLGSDPMSEENTDPLDGAWRILSEEQQARVRAATPTSSSCGCGALVAAVGLKRTGCTLSETADGQLPTADAYLPSTWELQDALRVRESVSQYPDETCESVVRNISDVVLERRLGKLADVLMESMRGLFPSAEGAATPVTESVRAEELSEEALLARLHEHPEFQVKEGPPYRIVYTYADGSVYKTLMTWSEKGAARLHASRALSLTTLKEGDRIVDFVLVGEPIEGEQ